MTTPTPISSKTCHAGAVLICAAVYYNVFQTAELCPTVLSSSHLFSLTFTLRDPALSHINLLYEGGGIGKLDCNIGIMYAQVCHELSGPGSVSTVLSWPYLLSQSKTLKPAAR